MELGFLHPSIEAQYLDQIDIKTYHLFLRIKFVFQYLFVIDRKNVFLCNIVVDTIDTQLPYRRRQ